MRLTVTITAQTFTASCAVVDGKVCRADDQVHYMVGWTSTQVRRFCDQQRPRWQVFYGDHVQPLTDKTRPLYQKAPGPRWK